MKIFCFAILMMLTVFQFVYADMKTYFENGKVQTETTDEWSKSYYQSGQVNTIIPQKEGEPHGKAQTFYESGKLMSEMEYDNGSIVGVTKEYYESGKLQREHDRLSGAWKTYDENGQVTGEGTDQF